MSIAAPYLREDKGFHSILVMLSNADDQYSVTYMASGIGRTRCYLVDGNLVTQNGKNPLDISVYYNHQEMLSLTPDGGVVDFEVSPDAVLTDVGYLVGIDTEMIYAHDLNNQDIKAVSFRENSHQISSIAISNRVLGSKTYYYSK
jgi:hypothetical protein